MNKRNTQQRRHSIISLLNSQGEVSVDELSLRFETSEVTIRKDLATLEKTGLLLRRYGGAVAIPDEVTQAFSSKIAPNKLSIAKAAAELINDHNRIIIDSGSTTSGLIQQLNHKRGLLVMTNSLQLANAIHELENEPTLLMTGGTWDPHSESFQGQIAEQVLRSYNFDQLFIGADGIDLARGTTTFNELTGLSKVMAEVSRDVIVMLESDKFGRRIPNLELPWSNISVLVTDDKLPAETVATITEYGVRVILAPHKE
ncbi:MULTISPECIES: DeoR family transcriptional regulator [unclassified Shewanella]|uniref:DeoR/GlpR family DNA-binding transcription regulator n=1 Tax=unclassified Shewanella TaxID=196818 RepID=UPI000C85B768|nr:MULTISPECIES: DeoR family transcriptional regulator [unclassified Shewanella]MDO6619059.1 DeoR family transcriptional regulator [Shewanella sp. 6_MG-2023]MDO6640889.1 DeoR family transcriptional regulator [Shewanella sp. 5_MG-2023]MDO6776014.1 DeoR family transcriptional regulator [Shewanella sp. 3_MG-2023]PMG30845.1 XRE family transcriptional regulator [Shewanella sp. 10N.286.52.C2]PMG51171.1 XRE family transcriptional regulator [Shewanella sp. 10N.286.52.B9]